MKSTTEKEHIHQPDREDQQTFVVRTGEEDDGTPIEEEITAPNEDALWEIVDSEGWDVISYRQKPKIDGKVAELPGSGSKQLKGFYNVRVSTGCALDGNYHEWIQCFTAKTNQEVIDTCAAEGWEIHPESFTRIW